MHFNTIYRGRRTTRLRGPLAYRLRYKESNSSTRRRQTGKSSSTAVHWSVFWMYSILWCTYLVIRLRGITETEVCGQPDNIVRVVVNG